MLESETRLSNFEIARQSAAAGGVPHADLSEQILKRHAEARELIQKRITDGYSARRLELPASVWIASSPIEAAEMLRRPGVEVVLMPIGQALESRRNLLADNLPPLDPQSEIATSWSLNHRLGEERRTLIADAEPLFTQKVVGGRSYADHQNEALLSSALGVLSVCQLAHPESNDWQLVLTREDHKTARRTHVHRGEISAVVGVVGPGVQLKNRILVDGGYTDLIVPPGIVTFFKGPREFGGSNIFGRYGVPHQTPQPNNQYFPYEKRLAVLCYANARGKSEAPPAREPDLASYLEIYRRHLSNPLFKISDSERASIAQRVINLE